eukprot:196374_1
MGFLTKSRGKKRKFKPPKSIQSSSVSHNPTRNPSEPPSKKQRTSSCSSPSTNRFFQHINTNNNNENSNPNILPKKQPSFKRPRLNSNNSPIDFAKKRQEQSLNKYGGPRTWNVFHCKRSNKKHKNYLDGILRHDGKKLYLFDTDSAKQITTVLWNKNFQKKKLMIMNHFILVHFKLKLIVL